MKTICWNSTSWCGLNFTSMAPPPPTCNPRSSSCSTPHRDLPGPVPGRDRERSRPAKNPSRWCSWCSCSWNQIWFCRFGQNWEVNHSYSVRTLHAQPDVDRNQALHQQQLHRGVGTSWSPPSNPDRSTTSQLSSGSQQKNIAKIPWQPIHVLL